MLDIIGFGQRRAVGSQRLLISAPMELLGVGEKSVQISRSGFRPKGGLEGAMGLPVGLHRSKIRGSGIYRSVSLTTPRQAKIIVTE